MARKHSTSPAEEPAAAVLPAQPTAIAMPAAVPAGLVRISNGRQERFIWPVHLSGWQQQGWSLIAAATGVQITPAQEPSKAERASEGSTTEALLLDDPLL